MIEAWTDYPFMTDDEAGQKAPIRPVTVIDYDADKYVTVLYNGEQYEFKAGYLYSEPGRCGEVPCVGHDVLRRNFLLDT